jgi:hypothetical protein
MCAGAKSDWAKHITKHELSKNDMKSGVLKCTKRLDFIFEFEYRNAVLSRGSLIHKHGRGSCAQENLEKPWETILPLKRGFLWNSLSNPECPGYCPECPGNESGVSGRLSGVSELLLPVRKTLWFGVSRSKCPEYPDIYSEYSGTLLPMASFCERGYKYPPYPFIYLLSCSFWPELPTSKREPSHFPFAPLLSDFLRGFKWDCCKS